MVEARRFGIGLDFHAKGKERQTLPPSPRLRKSGPKGFVNTQTRRSRDPETFLGGDDTVHDLDLERARDFR